MAPFVILGIMWLAIWGVRSLLAQRMQEKGERMRFRKYRKTVEAVQWNGPDKGAVDAIQKWGCAVKPTAHWSTDGHPEQHALLVPTPNGEIACSVGDYIVRCRAGMYYPYKPYIFNAIYEPEDPGTDE
jgi:hypothetical protein